MSHDLLQQEQQRASFRDYEDKRSEHRLAWVTITPMALGSPRSAYAQEFSSRLPTGQTSPSDYGVRVPPSHPG